MSKPGIEPESLRLSVNILPLTYLHGTNQSTYYSYVWYRPESFLVSFHSVGCTPLKKIKFSNFNKKLKAVEIFYKKLKKLYICRFTYILATAKAFGKLYLQDAYIFTYFKKTFSTKLISEKYYKSLC